MRLAVAADIHGNLEAFRAVLADMEQACVDEVISLGDNIGYGPDPEAVIQLLIRRQIPSVAGNHEAVIQAPKYEKRFNPSVRRSLPFTVSALSDLSVRAIREMPFFRVRQNCRFVHGFPPKSPFLYLFQVSERKMRRTFRQMKERICFVGHTHELSCVNFDGNTLVYEGHPERAPVPLKADRRYVFNIGSVGQPRDGDPRAKYAVWDTEADTVEIRFVAYDIDSVIRKIMEAGLPESFGNRLR